MAVRIPSIFVYICICASLVPGWWDEFYLCSVFKISSSIGRCLMNIDIPAPKIRGPSKCKMAIFLQTTQTILIKLRYFMDTISEIKLNSWYHQEKGWPKRGTSPLLKMVLSLRWILLLFDMQQQTAAYQKKYFISKVM